MKSDVTEILRKKASQSKCRFKVAAVAFNKRGELIATAVNKPRLAKLGGGEHAEMALLRKARGIRSIVVCRVGHSGIVRPIEICDACRKVLNKLNIKAVTISC
jgi:cytidine deaminase